MITSDLQSRLHVVVVGHADGAGRAVVWRAPGVGDDADAVRQAAVLPPGERFLSEPGWLLRKLPSGRWLLLAGGTQHDDLRDSFGRTGIFHGCGFVASAQDMGVALCAVDAPALCFELARLAVGALLAPSKHLDGAISNAEPVVKTRLIPSREARTELASAHWPEALAALRKLGMRPAAGPVGSQPAVAWGQPKVEAKRQTAAMQTTGAKATAQRIIAAWSS